MNGPEHYRLAQDLLEGARTKKLLTPEEFSQTVAMAQAHATLALAAATADSGPDAEGWVSAFYPRKSRDYSGEDDDN